MCLGAQARAQNEAARRQYKAANEKRESNWMQQLSVQNLKNVQYEQNMDRSGLAMQNVRSDVQRQKLEARQTAELKYEQAYANILKNSKYSKLLASGATGRSAARAGRLESAEYGKKVAEISRKVLLTDAELERQAAKQTTKLKGFRDEQFANVVFQPIPDAKPPVPVMQSVGAAAFMDALSIGSSLMAFSDRRLKENIKKIGESISGLGIYTFNYIGKGTKYIGTMADEVLKVKPEAVVVSDGFMAVNYQLIDVNFKEIK